MGEPPPPASPYESPELLAQYLLLHYGEAADRMPWPGGADLPEPFPVRSVRELIDLGRLPAGARALDLGCAVGRSALELSRHCREVVASDLSATFVGAAREIAAGGEVPYELHVEGHLAEARVARAPVGCRPGRVRFEIADACDLPEDLGGFDLVHAANLLCRLPRPARLLRRLPDLVKPGGQLALATPSTWLGEFTPPARWPAGSTLGWLREELGGDFDLQETRNLPMLIRETARKFQWTMSEGSRWIRR